MKTNIKSDDRVLVLAQIDGTKPTSSTGLVDPRLFKGGNNLHALKDPTNMWMFKYESGGLPEPLKGKYTSFNKALEAAKLYFNSRNVTIKEVIE